MLIDAACETRTIDGVEIVFQLVPGSEAPAEMLMYFPQFRRPRTWPKTPPTTCTTSTPSAAPRCATAMLWSRYINEALERFGDRTDVVIAQHHWPVWGNARVVDLLKKQRDIYKFMHDQIVAADEPRLHADRDRREAAPAAEPRAGMVARAATTARSATTPRRSIRTISAGTTPIRPTSIRCRRSRTRARRSNTWAAPTR